MSEQEETRDEDDDISFGWLAMMYPHETHATYPERFWGYFQTQCPGVSREEMERLLREDGEAN